MSRPGCSSGSEVTRPTGLRVRQRRVWLAGSSLAVTLVSVLGGTGLLPQATYAAARPTDSAVQSSATTPRIPDAQPPRPHSPTPAASRRTTPELPADSGRGRRVVFDISAQRVWIVGRDGVRRTYEVSGSVTDNLRPGTYAVWSRSRWAVGIGDSGTMQYFVRFAHGVRAAIGFHSIPTLHGRAVQTRAQLGTPQSHGCIRQARPDAQAMWAFAQQGTKVVVTA